MTLSMCWVLSVPDEG